MPAVVMPQGDLQPEDRAGGSWLTWSVGIVLALLFCVAWAQEGFVLFEGLGVLSHETLLAWGACEVVALRDEGQWWRLLSANFTHFAWWHALLNIWSWVALGDWVEARLGRRVLVLTALLGGVAGTSFAMLFSGAPMVGGFSASAFAIGGLLVGGAFDARLADFPRRQLLFWLGVTLALGLVVDGISQAGHIGGLLAGFAIAGGLRLRGASFGLYVFGIAGLIVFCGLLALRPAQTVEQRTALVWAHIARSDWDAAADLRLALGGLGGEAGAMAANEIAYEFALAGERLGDAIELADLALWEVPGDPNILDTRGWLACRLGRVEEGREFLRLAIEAGSDAKVVVDHFDTCAEAGLPE